MRNGTLSFMSAYCSTLPYRLRGICGLWYTRGLEWRVPNGRVTPRIAREYEKEQSVKKTLFAALAACAGALCAAFAQGGEVTGGNSQFYFVTALPNSVDETMQQQLRDNGYSDEQVSAYAAAGGLPYLDNTDTVFGQVYAGMDVVDQIACVPTVKNEDETDTYRPQEDSTVTIYKVTIDNYPGPSADDTADSAASDSSAQ